MKDRSRPKLATFNEGKLITWLSIFENIVITIRNKSNPLKKRSFLFKKKSLKSMNELVKVKTYINDRKMERFDTIELQKIFTVKEDSITIIKKNAILKKT